MRILRVIIDNIPFLVFESPIVSAVTDIDASACGSRARTIPRNSRRLVNRCTKYLKENCDMERLEGAETKLSRSSS